MSLALPAPRPSRSQSLAPVPFRVVLPDLDQVADNDRRLPGQSQPPSAEPRLVLAPPPEPESPHLPESPIPTPTDASAPRGLVILEQVLGRRDAAGRPVTFARRLRHRLFGFALGLTIVSAAALVVGLVGDIDNQGLSLREEFESLGTSSFASPDDVGESPYTDGANGVRAAHHSIDANRNRQEEIQAAEAEALESGERPAVWLEGRI
ncbi:MAG: hypothetical protein NT069_24210, partial [Planctomycetota bacterium]|nr:hypothetical protein [Planctomycetota bacterium]